MIKKLCHRILRRLYALRKKRERRILFFGITNFTIRAVRKIIRSCFSVIEKIALAILPSSLKIKLYPVLKKFSRHRPQARRYIKTGLTIEDFFTELKKRDIQYVILRWFDDLPRINAGEDLDILIADNDISRISDLISDINNNNQQLDIYSVSGLSGTNYRAVPYYPPRLGKVIIEHRIWHKDIFAVPDSKHHFLSFAYHVIFHKGQKSGLPTAKNIAAFDTGDHDYKADLLRLSKQADISLNDINFENVHAILQQEKWTPELDTLRILSRNDPLLQALLPSKETHINKDGELLVFVVRQWALDHHKLDFIKAILEENLLDIIDVKILGEDEITRATNLIRGGKWDQGPYPVSGGRPAALIMAYDYAPIPPSDEVRKLYPYVGNANILIKHKIRDQLNAERILFHHTNCIHSADDETEAWHYIEHVLPSKTDHIKDAVKKRRDIFKTDYPVLHIYKANGTRAKTEKIDFNGQIAVKKTFRLGCERFAEREAFAYKTFNPLIDTIPPLLDSGPNHIVIPWYDNILPELSSADKKETIHRHTDGILKTLRCFYDHGYAIIGFYPGNLIITKDNDLKIVDFEFLYPYETKPEKFSHSYDLAGTPKNFDGDLPRGTRGKGHTFQNTWRPYMGSVILDT